MRVLEVGTGLGHVTLITAGIVGPRGHVTTVDVDAKAIDVARERVAAASFSNVEFIAGTLDEFTADAPFDALVGRMILIHQPHPAATLAKLSSHVRPDGIICFQEPWNTAILAHPALPALTRCADLTLDAYRDAGIHNEMGARLYSVFVEAGLPPPVLLAGDAMVAAAPDIPSFAAEMLGRVATMRRAGVSRGGELDIELLLAQVGQELRLAPNAVAATGPMIGAWARRGRGPE
jgi:SAM-dependent methyltransferase